MDKNLGFFELMEKIQNPVVMCQLERFMSDTYEKWIDIFYQQLDVSVIGMQDTAKYYPIVENKDNGVIRQFEDSLTHHLIRPLIQLGYNITHDTYTNGHVDIKAAYRDYIWLGEAKVYTGYTKLLDGFKQLTTRYSSGETKQNQGGIIIYYYNEDTSATMKTWEKKLKEYDTSILTSDCPNRTGLCFFSNHIHRVSGLAYKTRHMPVMLHYDPLK